MARPVVGVFSDRMSAERAITDLKDAGFDPSRMGLLMQNREETKEAAKDTGVKAAGGAVTGGVIGGALGAILAATGTFVIPGIGPFVSAGILATAIAGGAVGAIAGGLVGLGIPKPEAEYYEQRVRAGGVLVTVDAQGHDAEAREILLRDGAEDTWRAAPWETSHGRMESAADVP
ncbi:MAG TPA: general stress protein [Ktedonobacterales bacterium]